MSDTKQSANSIFGMMAAMGSIPFDPEAFHGQFKPRMGGGKANGHSSSREQQKAARRAKIARKSKKRNRG